MFFMSVITSLFFDILWRHMSTKSEADSEFSQISFGKIPLNLACNNQT